MNAPQIIKTETGEELVVLTRADYDTLMAIAEDAAEDDADARLAAERLADIAAGGGGVMTAAASGDLLTRNGYLRAARKERGMTQAQVAETAGVAQGYLSDIEAGRRKGSSQVLAKIAETLGLPAEQFA